MIEAGFVLLFLGVSFLLLSYKQLNAIFYRVFKASTKKEPVIDVEKKVASSASASGSVYGSNEPLPDPTPLMITPEEVSNYDDRPWRPFRWPYHQTMAIFKLDINHWLDMDKYYMHYIKEKERIRHKYGKQNFDMLPEGYDGCFELMETVTNHLIARYPLLFTVLKDGNYEKGKTGDGKIIRNEITKEILDMTLPLKESPLVYVSKLAKEDFYVVKKKPN